LVDELGCRSFQIERNQNRPLLMSKQATKTNSASGLENLPGRAVVGQPGPLIPSR
jgi:hypothetical protein